MKGVMDVSICIVSYNVKEYLEGCLTSIFENVKEVAYEIIVVDNNSNDGSADAIEKNFAGHLSLRRNDDNVGFPKAANQAIRASKGRYILLLNPDTIALPGAIETLFKFMEEHTDAAACGPKIIDRYGNFRRKLIYFPTWGSLLSASVALLRIKSKFPDFYKNVIIKENKRNKITEVGYVPGACMLMRRKVLDEIGLLDERFFMFSEEPDWCLRSIKKHWKIYYVPQASIIHTGGASVRQNCFKMAEIQQESELKFLKKNYSFLYYLLARLVYKLSATKFLISAYIRLYLLRDKEELQRESIKLCYRLLRR